MHIDVLADFKKFLGIIGQLDLRLIWVLSWRFRATCYIIT